MAGVSCESSECVNYGNLGSSSTPKLTNLIGGLISMTSLERNLLKVLTSFVNILYTGHNIKVSGHIRLFIFILLLFMINQVINIKQRFSLN